MNKTTIIFTGSKLSLKLNQFSDTVMRGMLIAFGSFLAFLNPAPLYADPYHPTGGQVMSGDASIIQAGNTTTINQTSSQAIIHWQSFNIGEGQVTRFIQPSSNAIALNRVMGNDPSKILGTLSANGQVLLINPNGILFGKGSVVDVAGLIATTAQIKEADFLKGRYQFVQDASQYATVVNAGTIRVADTGLVALVAPGVENSGIIQANLGKVVLASGKEFTVVDPYGDQRIQFATDSQLSRSSVSNSGQIYADGGKVLMTAHAAAGVVDNVINMDGVIQANSVQQRNGEIILAGGAYGKVSVKGKLSARGQNANTQGGNISVLGDQVHLVAGANVDASGAMGGGQILIGGNYQGKGPEQNAQQTTVDTQVQLTANAITHGEGGKIIIWSDGTTFFGGHAFANGGASSGNGGLIETSGKVLQLDASLQIGATAKQGKAGLWLIDPSDLAIDQGIANIYAATLQGIFNNGTPTDVLLQADNNITFLADAQILWTTTAALTLQAGNNIIFENGTSLYTEGGRITLEAGKNYHGFSPAGQGIISANQNFIFASGNTSRVEFYYTPSNYATPTDFTSLVQVADGATFTPYMWVHNIDMLQAININLTGNYALSRNINAANYNFNPLGNAVNNAGAFRGILNGKGYSIDNLSINVQNTSTDANARNIGLFRVNRGTIKDIALTNLNIIATGEFDYIGGLVAQNAGTIENVKVTGTLINNGQAIMGGLVGINTLIPSLSVGRILNSATDIDLKSTIAGGLVGQNASLIQNSNSKGKIEASQAGGGLVGINKGIANQFYTESGNPMILNSFSSVDVVQINNSQNNYLGYGGLVGLNAGAQFNMFFEDSGPYNFNATISNSYATGNIILSSNNANVTAVSGSLVGANIKYTYSSRSDPAIGIITNSYATGYIQKTDGQRYGVLVGTIDGGIIQNNFLNTDLSGAAANPNDATLKNLVQFTQANTFSNWDFTNVWGIIEGQSMPYLRWQYPNGAPQVISGTTNATNLTNQSVAIVKNGSATFTDTIKLGANGFYYQTYAPGTFVAGDTVLAYLQGTAVPVGNSVWVVSGADASASYLSAGSNGGFISHGLNIHQNALLVRSYDTSFDHSTLKQAYSNISGLDVSNVVYSVDANNKLITSPSINYVVDSAGQGGLYNLNGSIDAGREVVIKDVAQLTSGSVTINTLDNVSFNNLTGANLTVHAKDLTFNGAVTLTGYANLTSTRNTYLNQDVSANSGVNLSAQALFLARGITTQNSAINLNTAQIHLTGADSTLKSGTGNMLLDGNIDGTSNLTLTTTGTLTLNGKLGQTTALNSLTIDQVNSTTHLKGGLIKTTGNQTYAGRVVLGNATEFISQGAIALTNTQNSFNNQTLKFDTQMSSGDLVIKADTQGVKLGHSTLGTGKLTVQTSGAITQVGAIQQQGTAGAVTVNSSASHITLDNTNNQFTGIVTLRAQGDSVLNNQGTLQLTLLDVQGNFTVAALGTDSDLTWHSFNSVTGKLTATAGRDINLSSNSYLIGNTTATNALSTIHLTANRDIRLAAGSAVILLGTHADNAIALAAQGQLEMATDAVLASLNNTATGNANIHITTGHDATLGILSTLGDITITATQGAVNLLSDLGTPDQRIDTVTIEAANGAINFTNATLSANNLRLFGGTGVNGKLNAANSLQLAGGGGQLWGSLQGHNTASASQLATLSDTHPLTGVFYLNGAVVPTGEINTPIPNNPTIPGFDHNTLTQRQDITSIAAYLFSYLPSMPGYIYAATATAIATAIDIEMKLDEGEFVKGQGVDFTLAPDEKKISLQ